MLIDGKEQLVTASTSAKSCSVGAFLARLVHLRQVHPLSVPPFASAVQSDSVRRPIGFRPPSNQIPFAVRSVSVRSPIGFRPPSVEKYWEKRCKNVVLNGNTIGDFAIFDVSVFRCFYYPHPNNLKSVGEYSVINSVSSAYSVGKNSAVNSVYFVKSVGEYSVINSVSSACSVGDHSVKPSMKSCFFVQFHRLSEKTPYKFGKIKLFSLSLPISLEIVIKQLQYNTHYIY